MSQWGIFVTQTSASWLVLIAITVITVAIETPPFDGGLASVGWPIGAALLAVVTNVIVVALGGGFRFFETTGRWLETHGGIMLAIAGAGILLIALSFLLGHPVDRPDDFGRPTPGFEAQQVLYWTGWFVTAAGIVHAWLPVTPGRPGPLANLSSTPEERELHRKLYGDSA
jgi:hypothetical protein